MAFNGVDCDHYPQDNTMALLRLHGQFRVIGLYLAHHPNSSDASWIAKKAYLANQGWGFIPTYVGYQITSDTVPPLSAAKGAQHAIEAGKLMQQAGFASSSVVYLDLESGDEPHGNYADYISAWIETIPQQGFTPALYCSHSILSWAFAQTKIVWSFHIPLGQEGVTYDPDNLPTGLIDLRCIATQYRQNIKLKGIPLSPEADSGGFDLDLCLVADPSNFAAVHERLGL